MEWHVIYFVTLSVISIAIFTVILVATIGLIKFLFPKEDDQ